MKELPVQKCPRDLRAFNAILKNWELSKASGVAKMMPVE
jgi:hypothetical protein